MVRTVVVAYWSIIALGVICLVSQILIPIAMGRQVFPVLRERNIALEGKLTEARTEYDFAQRAEELKDYKKRGAR